MRDEGYTVGRVPPVLITPVQKNRARGSGSRSKTIFLYNVGAVRDKHLRGGSVLREHENGRSLIAGNNWG